MEIKSNHSQTKLLLTVEEKLYLLRIARESIRAAVKRKSYSPDMPASPKLLNKAGAFVTIKRKGELRGCIGFIEPQYPIYQVVSKMAEKASMSDPRFESVCEDELEDLELEISVLSPLRRIGSFEEIEVGVHGLMVERGIYRGLLLPQVASENNWNREEFLEYTCIKAGLDKESYKNHGVCFYIFSAEVFGEKELGILSKGTVAKGE